MELTTNTFQKGLLMDTSPLIQGNDSLTYNLNGTFVTMNGNEIILQNDMGNRRVEEAYLPSGYMPVGIKEYGGVIYIAAYNPITGRGQIGSFPSPELKAEIIDRGGNGILWLTSTYTLSEDYNWFSGFLKLKSSILKLTSEPLRAGDKFSIYCLDFWLNYFGDRYINDFYSIEDDEIIDIDGFIDDIYNIPYNGTWAVGSIKSLDIYETSRIPNIYIKTDGGTTLQTAINVKLRCGNKVYYCFDLHPGGTLLYILTDILYKFFTLQIGILDSLNNFIDITDSLVRWNYNEIISSEKLSIEEYKKLGYFIASGLPTGVNEMSELDSNFLQERLSMPINTYAYKTVGPLCLKTTLNTISSFNYDLDVQVDANYTVTLTINCSIEAKCPLSFINVSRPSRIKREVNTLRYAEDILLNRKNLPTSTASEGDIYLIGGYYEGKHSGNYIFNSLQFKAAIKTSDGWNYLNDPNEEFILKTMNGIPAYWYYPNAGTSPIALGFTSVDGLPDKASGLVTHASELPSIANVGKFYILVGSTTKTNDYYPTSELKIYKCTGFADGHSVWTSYSIEEDTIYYIENGNTREFLKGYYNGDLHYCIWLVINSSEYDIFFVNEVAPSYHIILKEGSNLSIYAFEYIPIGPNEYGWVASSSISIGSKYQIGDSSGPIYELMNDAGNRHWEQVIIKPTITENTKNGTVFIPNGSGSYPCYIYLNDELDEWTPTNGDTFNVGGTVKKYNGSTWITSTWDLKYILWNNQCYIVSGTSSNRKRIVDRDGVIEQVKLPLFDLVVKELNNPIVPLSITNVEIKDDIYSYTATGVLLNLVDKFNYAILPKTAPLEFDNNLELYLKEYSVFGVIDPVEIHNNYFKVTGWNYYYENYKLNINLEFASWPALNEIRDAIKLIFSRNNTSFEYIADIKGGKLLNLELDLISNEYSTFFTKNKIYKVEILYRSNGIWEDITLVIPGTSITMYWWVITAPVLNNLLKTNSITDICALYNTYKANLGTLTPLEEKLKEALTIKVLAKPVILSGTITTTSTTEKDFPYSLTLKNLFKFRTLYTVLDTTNVDFKLDWNQGLYPIDEISLAFSNKSTTETNIQTSDIVNSLLFDNDIVNPNSEKTTITNLISVNNKTYTIPNECFWNSASSNKDLILYEKFKHILYDAIDNLRKVWISYSMGTDGRIWLCQFNNNSIWTNDTKSTDLTEKLKTKINSKMFYLHIPKTKDKFSSEANNCNDQLCVAGVAREEVLAFKVNTNGSDFIPDYTTSWGNAILTIWIKLKANEYGILYVLSDDFGYYTRDGHENEYKTLAKNFLNGSLENKCYGFHSDEALERFDTTYKYGKPSNIDYFFPFRFNTTVSKQIYSINLFNCTKYNNLKTLGNTYNFSCGVSLTNSSNLVEFILDSNSISSSKTIYPFESLDLSLNDERDEMEVCKINYILKNGSDYYILDELNNPLLANSIYIIEDNKVKLEYDSNLITISSIGKKIGNDIVMLPIVNNTVLGFTHSSLKLSTSNTPGEVTISKNNDRPTKFPFICTEVATSGGNYWTTLDIECDILEVN